MVAEDLEHSIQVAEKALEIGGRMRTDLDMKFIGRGTLFHDLGKTITHGITHGHIGAEKGAETQFRDIFRDEIKYEKNEITTNRYSRYHVEIHGLMR